MTKTKLPLIPPVYVNVSASIAFSNTLPDPIFRTYTRLVALAWRDATQTRLPEMSLDTLADICHLKRRAMRLHLDRVHKDNLITLSGDQTNYLIRIVSPTGQAAQQRFAQPVLPLADDAAPSTPQEPVQSFALGDPRAQANLDALVEFDVNPRIADAQRVAALPHVTPDLVRAWGQCLAQRPKTRNLPGLLLYMLSTNTTVPRSETRGGDRSDGGRQSPLPQQTSLPWINQPRAAAELALSPEKEALVNLLLFLAQELAELLDRKIAVALVQPYTQEQIIKTVYYARTADGLTKSRLGYAIKALRQGNLPEITLPQEERERYYHVGVQECSAGECTRLDWVDGLCLDCQQCSGCCSCARDIEEQRVSAPKRLQPAPTEAPPPTTPDGIWQAVLGELQLQMTRETFNTWLKPTGMLGREGDVFTVGVENAYVKEWLSNRLLATILRTMTSIVGREVKVKFVVWSEKQGPAPDFSEAT